MRIAVIGAGFSGLGLAWHLLNQAPSSKVVLFDPAGVGGGASGMAAGLLHPYVGEEGRRSMLGTDGMDAAKVLLGVAEEALGKKVADRSGIIRLAINEELRVMFHSHSRQYGDIHLLEGQRFLIDSGMTVDCPSYLEGLWKAVQKKGAELVKEKIDSLYSLKNFDKVIIAAGAGVVEFPELASFKCRASKGQVLVCRANSALELPKKSLIGKGYIALSSEPKVCYVGSTYEKGEVDAAPDVAIAKEILIPKIGQFFPTVKNLEVIGCRAAMRVTRPGHYFPIAARVKQDLYVMTALGSRGLLYHALLARIMAVAVLTGNDKAFSFLSIPGALQ